jgi:hypothetical protein
VNPWVLNFPTKSHWRRPSRLEDIVSRLEIPVQLYAPFATPHEQLTPHYLAGRRATSSPAAIHKPASKVAPAFVGLVAVLDRMEQDPYHWPVGSTTFQKLAYFATAAGLPTGLEFSRALYGPFAPGLRGIATQLLNNGLLRQERLGRMNAFKVGPTFATARQAYSGELERWHETVDRLADLLARMRTRDAELAASVHFAAELLMRELDRTPTEGEVMGYVVDWKSGQEKPPFVGDVADAVRNLGVLGWLELTPTLELPCPIRRPSLSDPFAWTDAESCYAACVSARTCANAAAHCGATAALERCSRTYSRAA